MPIKSEQHVNSLDGLRGIAALGVVLLHVCELWNIHIYNHLYLAVPFFFTLSGYVIAKSYESRLSSGMSLVRFMMIRLVRLYPMLSVSLVLAGLFRASWQDVFRGLFFLPSITDVALFPANGPQWSLLLEIIGNLIHAACLRWLTDLSVLLLVVSSGIGTAYAAVHFGNLEIGWGWNNLWGGELLFLFSYGIGVLIHRFERRNLLPTRSVPLLLLIVVYLVSTVMPQSRYGLFSAFRDMLCAAVIFPTIIVFAIRSSFPLWLDRMSKLSGEISYPLYIVHHPIVSALAPVVMSFGLSGFAIRSIGVGTILGSTIFAYVLLMQVDIPIRNWLSRIINSQRRQPSAGPV